MSKKNNKKSKVKEVRTPFDFGMDAEQKLADSLCKKFLVVGEDVEAIDDAFIGAFNALSHRMLTIFKKEFVLELVEDMHNIVQEELEEEYVCEDCQKEHEAETKTPGLTVVQGKGTVH